VAAALRTNRRRRGHLDYLELRRKVHHDVL
jgi:hypothetical protein